MYNNSVFKQLKVVLYFISRKKCLTIPFIKHLKSYLNYDWIVFFSL